MAELPTQGKIEATEAANGALLVIQALYPRLDDGQPLTAEILRNLVASHHVKEGVSEAALEAYTRIAVTLHRTLEKVIVAQGVQTFRKGVERVRTPFPKLIPQEDALRWRLADIAYNNRQPGDPIPELTVLVHAGDVIATKYALDEEIVGRSVRSEEIRPSRGQMINLKAGENVSFDERSNSFTARCCGYLILREAEIVILPALSASEDKMQLFFLDLPRLNPDESPIAADLDVWRKSNRAEPDEVLLPVRRSDPPEERVPVMAGRFPGASFDARIDFKINIDIQPATVEETVRVDFRERNLYRSVTADTLLAVKTLPIQGENGFDLYRNVVRSRTPQDAIIKHGPGVRVDKDEREIRYYSLEDGVIEWKNDILTILPLLTVKGDLDMSVGNIDAKANLEITGSVLTGFHIKSEKNVVIRGSVEEECVIECGGNLTVQGGVVGEHTRIVCGGAFSAKYIDGAHIHSAGPMSVQRYISRGHVECGDNLVVFGAGIDFNEHGAIVNSTIKVRGKLFTPMIGSEAGLTTHIHLAWDPTLENKITQLQDNCTRLQKSIAEILGQFPFDIVNPQIYNTMKDFSQQRKDEVIKAIQEKNRLDKQGEMLRKILDGEIAKKKKLLAESRVEVQRKIIPDLVIHANDMQHTIDKYEGPSSIFYDSETRFIERYPYTATAR
jgi:uncharacterized protein